MNSIVNFISINFILYTSIFILLIIRSYCYYDYTISRKEARNSFNLLIVALTCVDLVFCVALMSDYCFVRSFGLSTNIYTMMFPYFVYPLVNITLTASIYMTVILALERYVMVMKSKLRNEVLKI